MYNGPTNVDYKEYTTVDKATWPEGDWHTEPDKVQFQDEETGLPCLIVRHNTSGHLCGYVGVFENHPLFDVYYDDPKCHHLVVHGGITFCDFCQDYGNECDDICHVPADGASDRVWWFGFDMAHSGDLQPGYYDANWIDTGMGTPIANDILHRHDEYRNIGYVKSECADLAGQLSDMVED